MTVFFDPKRNKWRYDFMFNRQRYAGYCDHPKTGVHPKNKTEAKKIEEIIKGTIKGLAPGEVAPPAPVNGFALVEVMSHYLKAMKEKADFKNTQTHARELLSYFGPTIDINHIPPRLPEYKLWALEQKTRVFIGKDPDGNNKYKDGDKLRSPKLVNEYINTLVRAVNSFRRSRPKEHRHLVPEMVDIEYCKVPKRIPTPIAYTESQRLLAAMDPVEHVHLRLGYLLAINTGMREREITGVLDKQYNEIERTIFLHPEQTKSDTGRAIYINDIAHGVILECRKRGNSLWKALQEDAELASSYLDLYGIRSRGDIPLMLYADKKTKALRPVNELWTTAWDTIRKKAGVNRRGHDTRAAFCTNILSSGASIAAAKELAGHRSIETTMKYVKAANNELHAAVNQMAANRPYMVESHTEFTHKTKKAKEKPLKSG